MTTKAEQIVNALRRRGPSTCVELADATGVDADAISSMFREFIRRGKYGAVIVGAARYQGKTGNARKIMAIDEAGYATYMAARRQRHEEQVKRMELAKRLSQWECTRLPDTQFKTHWQPASPYYQEAA